jgi:hypothetical protein
VTFVNRDSNTDIPGCANLAVGLVNPADPKTGTVTCNWAVNIGSADSLDYTIGIRVDNYYRRDHGDDNAVVTVSKAIGENFITGGGYLIVTASAGEKAGDPNSRNNWGFNVKYNKTRTNLQGRINAIVRRTEGGVRKVYQIKGNAMTSLTVNPATCPNATPASPCAAVFEGKASIQDVTNPANPISVDGNATLRVIMTDKGEPGAQDSIGITVFNKNGGLWFSSNWSGTTTTEKILAGGNLVVH